MTKSDLKAGMLVELRDGTIGILIPIKDKLEVFNSNNTALTEPYLLTDDITDVIDISYSIIRVWSLSRNYDLFNIETRNLIWEYKESIKEMTATKLREWCANCECPSHNDCDLCMYEKGRTDLLKEISGN